MRSIFILSVLWLLSSESHAQFQKLTGMWVSQENEIMAIVDTSIHEAHNYFGDGKAVDVNTFLTLNKNVLSFQCKYFSSKTNYEKLYIDKYDFEIIKNTDSLLWVKPVSKKSKAFYKDKPLLKFIRLEYNVDPSLIPEKIIFHTSGCIGPCPIYHLQIDSSRKVLFHAEAVYLDGDVMGFNLDSSKVGYFSGMLSKADYNEIVEEIQTCNFKTFFYEEQHCCEGSVITIIVYYNNGQRRYIQSMKLPLIIEDLEVSLFNVCETTPLEKTSEKFLIESEK